MYLSFFGLQDNPFSIAPNPDYLYLSTRHREALAHLAYGLGESGGFVLLTGEVGTGKTTVARKLVQQLSTQTQVAMILNPSLSAQELLATVCDELQIGYEMSRASLKYFTDLILAKLASNHDAGLMTVLLVDEAQHLQADVLEQLRLLTNLETNRQKLLKVVLIGQPELQQLLKRNELRQLAQRITARYHLLPLDYADTGHYIAHRLQVAGGNLDLFQRRAVHRLYIISAGIPRVINLLCERALLIASSQQTQMISASIVEQASNQILGEDIVAQRLQSSRTWQSLVWVLLGIVLGYALGVMYD